MLTVRPGSKTFREFVAHRKDEIGWHTALGDVSRDGDLGRVAASAASDVDLGAGDVELGCTSDVEADVLDAEEVLANVGQRGGVQEEEKEAYLARRSTRREAGGKLRLSVGAELEGVEGGTKLGDLQYHSLASHSERGIRGTSP